MKPTPLALLSLALFTTSAIAQDWSNWRGPAFNGTSTATDLPTKFGKDLNVQWTADLKGEGASVPVVLGDRIFITSAEIGPDGPTGDGKLKMLCLDRKTGKELWAHEVIGRTHIDNKSNSASPSAVTNGKQVAFFFGTGSLYVFDLEGKKLWEHSCLKDGHYFAFQWTFASTPLLMGDKLILQILQRDQTFELNDSQRGQPGGNNPSYLLCLDAATGAEKWRVDRPSEAKMESLESFATPTPATIGGVEQFIIAGGDCLTGHDPKTGEELWRWGTWNPGREQWWRLVPTPVVGEDIVIIPAPKKQPIYAVKVTKEADGAYSTDLAWSSDPKEATSDVSTPAYHDGKFYVIDGDRRDRALVCLNPADGKVLWRGVFDSKAKMEAAPTIADGKVYAVDHSGMVFVAKADGDKFELLHQVDMAGDESEPARTPVVPVGNRLLIRMGAKLYCIGEGGH